MAKIALILKNRSRPGKRDEVRRLYEQHLTPRANANTEQEVVVWCDDKNNPDFFYLFEIYANEQAPMANANALWFAEYLKAAGPLLVGQGEMFSATPKWAKGVKI